MLGIPNIFCDIKDGATIELRLSNNPKIDFTAIAMIGAEEAVDATLCVDSSDRAIVMADLSTLWVPHMGKVTLQAVKAGNADITVTGDFGECSLVTHTIHVVVIGDNTEHKDGIYVGTSETVFLGTTTEACETARGATEEKDRKIRIKGIVETTDVLDVSGITIEGYTQNREENILKFITSTECAREDGAYRDSMVTRGATSIKDVTIDANETRESALRILGDGISLANVIVQNGTQAGIGFTMVDSEEEKHIQLRNVLARDNTNCGFLFDGVGNASGILFDSCITRGNRNLSCPEREQNGILLTNFNGDLYAIDMSGILVEEGAFSIEDRRAYGDNMVEFEEKQDGDDTHSKYKLSWLYPPRISDTQSMDISKAQFYSAGVCSGFQYGNMVEGRSVTVNIRGRYYSEHTDTVVYYSDNPMDVWSDVRAGEEIQGLYSIYEFEVTGSDEYIAGERYEDIVRLYASQVNKLGYDRVRIKIELLGKTEGARTPEIIVNDGMEEYSIGEQGYCGSENGFAVGKDQDKKLSLTYRFFTSGSYRLRFSLVDVSGKSEVVLMQKTVEKLVGEKAERLEGIGEYEGRINVSKPIGNEDKLEIKVEKIDDAQVDFHTINLFAIQYGTGTYQVKKAEKMQSDEVLILTIDEIDAGKPYQIFLWDNEMNPCIKSITIIL